jgi:hypothetical protein
MSYTNLIKYEYHPHDLEKTLPPEFQEFKNEIIRDLKKSDIMDQNFIQIDYILISISQNTHLGEHTYETKISLISTTPDVHYVHTLESKSYIQNIRQSVNDLIRYVLAKKEELSAKSKGR